MEFIVEWGIEIHNVVYVLLKMIVEWIENRISGMGMNFKEKWNRNKIDMKRSRNLWTRIQWNGNGNSVEWEWNATGPGTGTQVTCLVLLQAAEGAGIEDDIGGCSILDEGKRGGQ